MPLPTERNISDLKNAEIFGLLGNFIQAYAAFKTAAQAKKSKRSLIKSDQQKTNEKIDELFGADSQIRVDNSLECAERIHQLYKHIKKMEFKPDSPEEEIRTEAREFLKALASVRSDFRKELLQFIQQHQDEIAGFKFDTTKQKFYRQIIKAVLNPTEGALNIQKAITNFTEHMDKQKSQKKAAKDPKAAAKAVFTSGFKRILNKHFSEQSDAHHEHQQLSQTAQAFVLQKINPSENNDNSDNNTDDDNSSNDDNTAISDQQQPQTALELTTEILTLLTNGQTYPVILKLYELQDKTNNVHCFYNDDNSIILRDTRDIKYISSGDPQSFAILSINLFRGLQLIAKLNDIQFDHVHLAKLLSSHVHNLLVVEPHIRKAYKSYGQHLVGYLAGLLNINTKKAHKLLMLAMNVVNLEHPSRCMATVSTIKSDNKEKTILELDLPLTELTNFQKTILGQPAAHPWFSNLSNEQRPIIRWAINQLLKGSRQLPTQLGNIIPCLRNSYRKEVFELNDGLTLVTASYHCGNVAFLNSDIKEKEQQEIADENMRQLQAHVGGAITMMSLNSRANPTGPDKKIVSHTANAADATHNCHVNLPVNKLRKLKAIDGRNIVAINQLLADIADLLIMEFKADNTNKESDNQDLADFLRIGKTEFELSDLLAPIKTSAEAHLKSRSVMAAAAVRLRQAINLKENTFGDEDNLSIVIASYIHIIASEAEKLGLTNIRRACSACRSNKDRAASIRFQIMLNTIYFLLHGEFPAVVSKEFSSEAKEIYQSIAIQIAQAGHTQRQSGHQGTTEGTLGIKKDTKPALPTLFGNEAIDLLVRNPASYNKKVANQPGNINKLTQKNIIQARDKNCYLTDGLDFIEKKLTSDHFNDVTAMINSLESQNVDFEVTNKLREITNGATYSLQLDYKLQQLLIDMPTISADLKKAIEQQLLPTHIRTFLESLHVYQCSEHVNNNVIKALLSRIHKDSTKASISSLLIQLFCQQPAILVTYFNNAATYSLELDDNLQQLLIAMPTIDEELQEAIKKPELPEHIRIPKHIRTFLESLHAYQLSEHANDDVIKDLLSPIHKNSTKASISSLLIQQFCQQPAILVTYFNKCISSYLFSSDRLVSSVISIIQPAAERLNVLSRMYDALLDTKELNDNIYQSQLTQLSDMLDDIDMSKLIDEEDADTINKLVHAYNLALDMYKRCQIVAHPLAVHLSKVIQSFSRYSNYRKNLWARMARYRILEINGPINRTALDRIEQALLTQTDASIAGLILDVLNENKRDKNLQRAFSAFSRIAPVSSQDEISASTVITGEKTDIELLEVERANLAYNCTIILKTLALSKYAKQTSKAILSLMSKNLSSNNIAYMMPKEYIHDDIVQLAKTLKMPLNSLPKMDRDQIDLIGGYYQLIFDYKRLQLRLTHFKELKATKEIEKVDKYISEIEDRIKVISNKLERLSTEYPIEKLITQYDNYISQLRGLLLKKSDKKLANVVTAMESVVNHLKQQRDNPNRLFQQELQQRIEDYSLKTDASNVLNTWPKATPVNRVAEHYRLACFYHIIANQLQRIAGSDLSSPADIDSSAKPQQQILTPKQQLLKILTPIFEEYQEQQIANINKANTTNNQFAYRKNFAEYKMHLKQNDNDNGPGAEDSAATSVSGASTYSSVPAALEPPPQLSPVPTTSTPDSPSLPLATPTAPPMAQHTTPQYQFTPAVTPKQQSQALDEKYDHGYSPLINKNVLVRDRDSDTDSSDASTEAESSDSDKTMYQTAPKITPIIQ